MGRKKIPVTKEDVVRALKAHDGLIARATKMLGIQRHTLMARMDEFGLTEYAANLRAASGYCGGQPL